MPFHWIVMPPSGRSFPLMNETSFPNLAPLGQLALERVDRPLMAYLHRFFRPPVTLLRGPQSEMLAVARQLHGMS
jgi:hypothetical protein